MEADLRVFAVDDDPGVLRALERMLRVNNIAVESFTSPAAFLERPPSDGVACLLRDRWVGNVRELAHVIERATLMVDGDVIEARHLRSAPIVEAAEEAPGAEPATPGLEAAERQLIQQALEEAHGNVSGAARRLGVSRELLRYRARKHGLR